MDLAPVVLFVYNRLDHTKKTVEALQKNYLADKSELIIFSDGAKDRFSEKSVNDIRKYIKGIEVFKDVAIIERDKNLGLAQSIILGVEEVINKCGKVIVIEDDLLSHPQLLTYMNNALNFYEKEQKVFSITGFNHPSDIFKISADYKYTTYFSYRASSWSWATWKDRWNMVDFEVKNYDFFMKDKNEQALFNRGGDDLTRLLIQQMKGIVDSWAIRFCYSQHKHKMYTLYPVDSLIHNIGLDGSGVHCSTAQKDSSGKFQNRMFDFTYPESVEPEPDIAENFKKVFHRTTLREKLKKIFKLSKNFKIMSFS